VEQTVPHVLVIQPLKDRERAEPLLQALERAGLTMVRNGERAGPSADEKTDLSDAIHSAAAVLVLWTSVGLQSGWVPGEVDLAARAGKLVPVTLDGASVIPSQFQRYATLDLSGWSDDADDPRFRELIRVLQSRLAGASGTRSEVGAPATTASPTAEAPPAVPRSRPASRTSGFDQLGKSAVTALEYAEGLRKRLGLGEVHMEHLVEGLFQEGVGRRELLKAGVDHAQLTAIVADVAHTTFPPNVRPYGLTAMPPLSQHAARAVDNALGARRRGRSVTSAALWNGVLAVQGCSMTKALLERGVGRRSADEPRGSPEETPPPSPAPDATREHVHWVSDDPVALEADSLGRRGVAEALDSQLRELVGKFPGQSFLVHVDGSWGAGKSTLLRFLNHLVTHPSRRGNDGEASRSGDVAEPWLVVDYDAWRQSRVGPPWLTLLQAIRSAVRRDHHPWWRRVWFSVRERARLISPWQWTALIVMATITVLLVVLVLVTADRGISVTAWGDVAKLVGGLVPVVAAVWLIAGLAGRFLSLDSRRSARAFLENRSDPMEDLATHFQWVLRQSGRPVLLLVDDLDRCPETFVVELLDAVQKLMREPHPIRLRGRGGVEGNAGADASPGANGNADAATPLVVVVAADGRWIRQAYDNAFASLDKAVREPGATIGSLFLEKLFQLTLPVPQLPDQLKQQYFTRLLAENGAEDGAAPVRTPSTQAQALARQVATAPRHQVLDVLAQASPADRLEVADKAIHRLVVEAGAEQETKHALEPFGPLLDPTPRAMKRFVMAYSVLRAVRTAEGSVVGVAPLALWTVVVTRWPLLAEFLQGDPTAVRYFSASPERVRSDVPPELRALFDDPPDDLRAVMNHDGGPLDADLIRECCGQLVRS
jgi:hypothetical protein